MKIKMIVKIAMISGVVVLCTAFVALVVQLGGVAYNSKYVFQDHGYSDL